MNVGKRIKQRRKTLGLSAEDLAAEIGISPATVYRYESSAIMNMRTDKLVPIAKALSTSPAYLMGWTDDPIDYEDADVAASIPMSYLESCGGNAKQALITMQEAYKNYTLPFGLQFREWASPLVSAYKAAEVSVRQSVCRVLDIDYADPDKTTIEKDRVSSNTVPLARRIQKLVYNDPAAAGVPLSAESDYEHIEYDEDSVPYNADFGIRISGRSMESNIHDGDIVWVHKQPNILDGQVGVFMIDDGAVCKRARTNAYGKLERLESDNKEYDDIIMANLDNDTIVSPIGCVVGVYHE